MLSISRSCCLEVARTLGRLHLAQSGQSATVAIEIFEPVYEERKLHPASDPGFLDPGSALPRPIESLLEMTCVGKVHHRRVSFP